MIHEKYSMKQNILMIPSWYPTKTNPIGGSFFQEQALALLSEFNFFVGYVEFKRLNIIFFLIRLFTFQLKPHLGKIDIVQPPHAISYIGYGLNVRRFSSLLPLFVSEAFVKWLNEKLEIKAHLDMYNYLVNKKNFKPDLIYAMTSLVNGVPVYALGQNCKLPIVLAEHVPFSIDALPYHKKDKIKTALESADRLLVVSYDKARQILMGNINCNPIVVGNLVNENVFKLKPDSRKQELPNILIIAAYNFYKDYSTFLKSMEYLRTITDKKFTITIVGIAPNTTKNMWAEGEEKFYSNFEKYNLSDITKIVNFASRDEVINYYHLSDLFVLTSIQEGLPVSVLEAMSCGLPVFSTRCGGVEDFLDDSCGRLFHLRDYKSIAESIKDFLEGRIFFDKQHIRDVVIEKFGLETFTQRMKKIFDQCIFDYSKEKGTF